MEFRIHAPAQVATEREQLYARALIEGLQMVIPVIGKTLGAAGCIRQKGDPGAS